MEIFLHSETWISLLTLTFLEIVLGIDNIIFISIVSDRLAVEKQSKARAIGLTLAILIRVLLLFGISYIVHLTDPILTIKDFDLSARDLILIAGGLFLLAKSTSEIHEKIEEGDEKEEKKNVVKLTMQKAIIQIILLDVVFSFDSILTAVGLSDHLIIMVMAVIISMLVMLAFAKKVSDFVNRNPTVKMLALAFLIMIGTLLLLDGFHVHVPKGYIYFSLAFSLFVEFLNQKIRQGKKA
ncbi:MAG: TerC family protein [Bacteroidetes bacterium]|nr:MAG: TerC family protein [Bacteroidota bacterium]MBL1144669.1 TerC family protein [Bacteroidota bacterium]NOG57463.1 TerC family protein [Bacteroidota bacterium]